MGNINLLRIEYEFTLILGKGDLQRKDASRDLATACARVRVFVLRVHMRGTQRCSQSGNQCREYRGN